MNLLEFIYPYAIVMAFIRMMMMKHGNDANKNDMYSMRMKYVSFISKYHTVIYV